MEKGERKLFSVLNGLKVKTVQYEGVDGLMNINTTQDLKALI
jgi:molybdopterin-guanine dinucleotide biosynthesis protein A